jgi:TRAP transporter TAXI family solute receptor
MLEITSALRGNRNRWLRWVRIGLVIVLILLPLLIPALYVKLTGPPDRVRIGTGPAGGRYRALCRAIGQELERRLPVQVEMIHTDGSADNLALLRRGEVDLALYQQSTWETLDSAATGEIEIAFVANLYEEPLHLIVRTGSGIEHVADLRGKAVNLGPRGSGDYGVSRFVLAHLGLEESELDAHYMPPDQIKKALLDGRLDAALVTMGMPAAMFEEVFAHGSCELWDVPFRDALAINHLFLAPFSIPAGTYVTDPHLIPDHEVLTVASTAQLITRSDIPSSLIETVTRLVHDQSFHKQNRLRELFIHGTEFSRRRPEFPIHRGARNFYEPALRPVLSPEFVESTEGIRSFLVSLGVAVFLLYRWHKQRRDQRGEHQLDRYIRGLLDIERRQLDLDSGDRTGDIDALQDLLDEVTALRQEALSTFSIHSLKEDRGVECFIAMCHGLSNKINAKMSRQRLDQAIHELAQTCRAHLG